MKMVIDRLDRIEAALHSRLNVLESRVNAVEKWQASLIGIGSFLVVTMTILGPAIRKVLRLE